MTEPSTTARLIAEMYDALSWRPPDSLSDHPILGPIIAKRSERYQELKSRGLDFTEARQLACAEAVQAIMDLEDQNPQLQSLLAKPSTLKNDSWSPTADYRWCKWDAVKQTTLQRKWVSKSGDIEWRKLPVVNEKF